MAKNYKEHYEKCQKLYAEQNTVEGKLGLSDINVTVVRPDEPSIIKLDAKHMKLIDKIHNDMVNRLNKKECLFFQPDVKRENDVVTMLKDSENFQVRGAEDLCQIILPQLESLFFKSYLHAEKCYFYRNIVTDNAPRTSWLWHYDNHPVETHKMIVYLTDVTEDSGPFEYLQSPEGKAVVVFPSRTGMDNWGPPKWKGSRIPPEVIKDFLDQGYKTVKVTGPRGTILLFDDNVMHKANLGKSGHRDVFAVQYRPAKTKMRPYLSPKWTGGYESNDLTKDPDIIAPTKKYK